MKPKKIRPLHQPITTERGRPTISVCLIAKNEEKNLDRCLRSVKSLADEVIIVDTGSTDRTLEIARKYTDKVWVHPWKDSFSEARNHYLEYASGDWIFQIDADEELVKEDIPLVHAAVRDKDVDVILIQLINTLDQASGKGFLIQERLLRNNGVIHYEGRVHNRVVGAVSARFYPIRILHYGYNPGLGNTAKKFARTVPLLLKDLADEPDNPLPHHYLSCSYLSGDRYAETIEHGLKALQLAEGQNNQDATFLWTRYNVCLAYYRQKQLLLAEEMAAQALVRYADHIDSHFMMIVICFDQKRWQDVIYHGSQYLRLLDTLHSDPVHFGVLVHCSVNEAWNIHVLLGIARYECGDQKFADSFAKAVQDAPEPFLGARAAGIYFANAGIDHLAGKYLQAAHNLNPNDELTNKQLEVLKKKKATISCVLIVKNEEVFLEKCLLSVKDWVDEIIIVDTGSDDDTVNIARRFTDKVYFHPWEGSFSKARNQAMQYATGDWIYQIDGDEEMVPGSGRLLREAVESAGDADAFLVTLISIFANGRKTSRHNFERLFRNNGVIHYESIVHNQVVGHTCTQPTKIEVMHYGYNVDEKKANEKFIRTTDLLKKQIAEAPDNPMPHHYLSASYLSCGFNKECIEEAEQAIALAEKNEDGHTIYLWSHYNAAMGYYFLGDMDSAERHARRAINKFPSHMDSYHVLTLIAMERENWRDIFTYSEKYMELQAYYETHSDEAGILINTTMREGASVLLLKGHACYKTGDRKRMFDHYRKSALLEDKPWQAWWQAAGFHLDKTHDYGEAKKCLDEALRLAPEEQDLWYALAKLCFHTDNRAEELMWLSKLAKAGNKEDHILNRLPILLIENGQPSEAIPILTDFLAANPDNLQALTNIGIACKRLRRYQEAIEYFMNVVTQAPEDPQPWFHLAEISDVLGKLDESRIFLHRAQALNEQPLSPLV